jgi:hypothetical protein
MKTCKSRDSSVGIALGYGLDDRGSRVRFPAGAGNFSLHHRVQSGSGAHPASYPMGTRGSFPGGKAAGCEGDHSPPSSAEVKNAWSYTSTSPYVFIAWCLVKHRDFTFLPLPWRLEVQVHEFLTLELHGGEWSASHPRRSDPGVRAPGTHCRGAIWAPELVWTRWRVEMISSLSLPETEPRSSGP